MFCIPQTRRIANTVVLYDMYIIHVHVHSQVAVIDVCKS